MRYLKDDFTKGILAPQLRATWLNMIARIWNNLTIVNYAGVRSGEVIREPTGRKWRLVIDIGVSFTGIVYLNGRKYEGLNSDSTKPWVVVPLQGGVPYQHEGPAPVDMGNNEWYLKANTSGDIHVIAAR